MSEDDSAKTREFIKGEYYSNILLVSDKIAPLTTIAEDRAEWYIERNLAEDIPEEVRAEKFPKYSRVVKLKFRPKYEDSADPFYQQIVETQCVICGERERLSLHHVVPSVIRKSFPEEHKNHSHGWCVLLCEKHHLEADKAAQVVHEQYIRALDKKVIEETKRIRKEALDEFVAQLGGIEKIKGLYRDRFNQLNPKYLPEGFLQDRTRGPLPMPEEIPQISLTNPESVPTMGTQS